MDLELDADGRFTLAGALTSDDLAQRVRIALRTHPRDWIPDDRIGLPWARWLTTRPVPVDAIRVAVRGVIAAEPEVSSVDVDAAFDSATGALTITARGRLRSGDTFEVAPFAVTG